MSASTASPAESGAHGAATRHVPSSVTSDARWIGGAILVFAGVLAIAAVTAGVTFTAPSNTQCPPPSGNGGQDVPCPPGPLTNNNLFVLITLVVSSLVFFALGTVVLVMVWFRAHPAD